MSLRIEPSNIYLYVGDTMQYTAYFNDEPLSNSDVIWSVSYPNVITIDENGLLTTLFSGYEFVYASTLDGVYSASAGVTVYYPNSTKLKSIALDDITFVHGVGGHEESG